MRRGGDWCDCGARGLRVVQAAYLSSAGELVGAQQAPQRRVEDLRSMAFASLESTLESTVGIHARTVKAGQELAQAASGYLERFVRLDTPIRMGGKTEDYGR